jgi:hypothetical protein
MDFIHFLWCLPSPAYPPKHVQEHRNNAKASVGFGLRRGGGQGGNRSRFASAAGHITQIVKSMPCSGTEPNADRCFKHGARGHAL